MAAEQVQKFNTAVCLCFTHYRHRYCDIDNLSVKAFIDGIVKAGILGDDSTKEVKEIRHRQVKVASKAEERTTLEIVRIEFASHET